MKKILMTAALALVACGPSTYKGMVNFSKICNDNGKILVDTQVFYALQIQGNTALNMSDPCAPYEISSQGTIRSSTCDVTGGMLVKDEVLILGITKHTPENCTEDMTGKMPLEKEPTK